MSAWFTDEDQAVRFGTFMITQGIKSSFRKEKDFYIFELAAKHYVQLSQPIANLGGRSRIGSYIP